MTSLKLLFIFLVTLMLSACVAANRNSAPHIRFATFNVSIEATNYIKRIELASDPKPANRAKIVQLYLSRGEHPQMRNIAEIIQTVRPDVLLLNEFDYIPNESKGIGAFKENYLMVSQNSQAPIEYPYHYIAPVNTGMPTEFDLDNDGRHTGNGNDAYGFGLYPGQYGMAILSKFPIDTTGIRTFQDFLWKDMPDALQPFDENAKPWYNDDEWSGFRLSSKSHWSVPIITPGGTIHAVAAHPTPPTFDGDEDRNGKRNHDEIRLIIDYLSNQDYLYDDAGNRGGLDAKRRFVVLGDLNASPDEGNAISSGINRLLNSHLVDASCVPVSLGAREARPKVSFAPTHTAAWGLRADYVLPSKFGVTPVKCGVFWPRKQHVTHRLISSRGVSSDHRLVWVDIKLD